MTRYSIKVTAAIIEKRGHYLIALRPHGDKHGGMWEFPGGKVELGETPEACLKREIQEELGIDIEVQNRVLTSCYSDDTTSIELSTYKVNHISGEPQAREHAALRWIAPPHFDEIEWSPADLPVVDVLRKAFKPGTSRG